MNSTEVIKEAYTISKRDRLLLVSCLDTGNPYPFKIIASTELPNSRHKPEVFLLGYESFRQNGVSATGQNLHICMKRQLKQVRCENLFRDWREFSD